MAFGKRRGGEDSTMSLVDHLPTLAGGLPASSHFASANERPAANLVDRGRVAESASLWQKEAVSGRRSHKNENLGQTNLVSHFRSMT